MNHQFNKTQDIRTKLTEFSQNQSKNDRSNIIHSKRLFMSGTTSEFDADVKIASFYQNVLNKDEIVQMIKSISEEEQPQPALLRKFLAEASSKDCTVRTHGMVSIRILFTKINNYSPKELIAYEGLLPIFAAMQDFLYPHLQVEAAWIVSYISGGSSEDTHALVHKGAILVLQKLLKCSFEVVIEHALYALGNICTDCQICRNIVYNSGILEPLLKLPERFKGKSIAKKITWIVSSILRLQPETDQICDKTTNLLSLLIRSFIETDNFDVMSDCVYGISRFSKLNWIDLFMNDEFLGKFRKFYEDLLTQKVSQHVSLISTIHEFLNGVSLCRDAHIMELIKFGFLKNLLMVLCTNKIGFLLDALLILSNFVIGNDFQVTSVLMESGLIDRILMLTEHPDLKIRKNSLWVICNMCGTSSADNIHSLVNQGMLKLFCGKLSLEEDSIILNNIIEALVRLGDFFKNTATEKNNPFLELMNESGISSKVEQLQYHKSENVYQKALGFMEKYLEVEND